MSIIAWSYSRLSTFETCPYKFKREALDKAYPFEETAAIAEGNRVHKALEERVRDGKPLTDQGLSHYEPLATKLESFKGTKYFERQFAFNTKLVQVDWFDKRVWLRGAVDYYVKHGNKIKALDYKTGKQKPGFDQLELFAAMLMTVHPDVDEVDCRYIWLKTMTSTSKTFIRDDLEAIWDKYRARSEAIQVCNQNDVWQKKRNGLCRNWCPVSDCEYNGDGG